MSTILIIEDDHDILEVASAFFRQNDFESITSDDPEQALSDLNKGKISADVILTDLKMPKMSGLDFLKRFKELNADIPVIAITSNRNVETAIEAIQAGAYDFVVKPLHFPQLLVSVQRALHFSNLKKQNQTLITAIQTKEGTSIENVIGKSPAFLKVLDLAKRVASSQSNVFISGESGTGKEVIARSIHNLSQRRDKPFVAINCSAIPETLLESELFGYMKGAFTGASDKKLGLFEEAEGGTLFLDEIGDMNLHLQSKLLRVLQDRKIKRLGENQQRDVDVRIISATHRDLLKEIAEGRFREDLFFRLNVIPIHIPPLRERKEDIVPLAEFFLRKFTTLNQSKVRGFSKSGLEALLQKEWRGNVRELENTIERAVVLSKSEVINSEDINELSDNSRQNEVNFRAVLGNFDQNQTLTIDKLMKLYIKHVLEKNHGAKEKTARELDIDRKTLYRKLQEMEGEKLL